MPAKEKIVFFDSPRKGPITLMGKGYGPNGRCTLAPGNNTISASAWPKVCKDSLFLHFTKNNRLRLLTDAEQANSEAAQADADKKVGDEPKKPDVVSHDPWKPTATILITLTDVGKATADKILDAMPEGGFTSPENLIELTGLKDTIDFEELQAIYGD